MAGSGNAGGGWRELRRFGGHWRESVTERYPALKISEISKLFRQKARTIKLLCVKDFFIYDCEVNSTVPSCRALCRLVTSGGGGATLVGHSLFRERCERRKSAKSQKGKTRRGGEATTTQRRNINNTLEVSLLQQVLPASRATEAKTKLSHP